jgi:hypothetical protein
MIPIPATSPSSNPSITSTAPWDEIEETMEVYPREVAGAVQEGWVILMTYNARDDVMETTCERGYQESRIRSEYKPVVLMGRTTLRSLREKAQILEAEVLSLRKADAEHQALKKQYEVEKKRAGALEQRLREIEERWGAEIKSRMETEQNLRKLEGEFSKVRAAIGEIGIKEILAQRSLES